MVVSKREGYLPKYPGGVSRDNTPNWGWPGAVLAEVMLLEVFERGVGMVWVALRAGTGAAATA